LKRGHAKFFQSFFSAISALSAVIFFFSPVTFSPFSPATVGTKSAFLTIPSNDSDEDPYIINLTANNAAAAGVLNHSHNSERQQKNGRKMGTVKKTTASAAGVYLPEGRFNLRAMIYELRASFFFSTGLDKWGQLP